MLDRNSQEKFRSFLRTDLMDRCKKNPRYSMRAYANFLGVQSSFLSKLLSGQRSITKRTIIKFSTPLALSPKQKTAFLNSKIGAMEHMVPISEEIFKVVSEWYHFAILELFTVKRFEPSSKYISRRLGISRITTIDALRRLERLGWIKENKKGILELHQGENTTSQLPPTTPSLRKLQKQTLEMAIQALEATPIDERDQSTLSMAIDSKLLPEAKQKIKLFRRELCDFLQKNRTTDSVYHLNISLYPVARAEDVKRSH